MPNVVGYFGISGGWGVFGSGEYGYGAPPTGPFTNITNGVSHFSGVHVGNASADHSVKLDLSRASQIYKDNAHVIPQSMQTFFYVKY